MYCNTSALSSPACGPPLRPSQLRLALKWILALVLITTYPAQAEQCPREDLSEFCCSRADPLDGMERSEGGYGWHPGPSGTAGLCQGLASRNVSGALIQLYDLRETETLNPLPDSLTIGYRDLPWSVDRPVVFVGLPLTSGNNFFIAGSFETGNEVIWDTRPFSQITGQKLSSFGFVAAVRHEGRIFYTPLILGRAGAPFGDRTRAQLVLQSTRTIESAAITIEPLDPDTLEPRGVERKPLPHTQPQARKLRVELPPALPTAFLLMVAICTAGTADCQATEYSPPTQQFRIIWPKP